MRKDDLFRVAPSATHDHGRVGPRPAGGQQERAADEGVLAPELDFSSDHGVLRRVDGSPVIIVVIRTFVRT
jgi:hypothetical protein